jgi:hypothetical protein
MALKRQYVAPMYEAYNRQLAEYEKTKRKLPRPPFTFQADLQTLVCPKMPTELLEKRIEKIPIQARGLAASIQLISSIHGLALAISDRNQLIIEVREASLDQKKLGERYLGLRSAEGIEDIRFGANMKAIFDQTNDCIFFAMILSEDLLTYGKRLRRRHMRRLRFSLPEMSKGDWSKAESEGLIPPRKLYKAWLDGFKTKQSMWKRFLSRLTALSTTRKQQSVSRK